MISAHRIHAIVLSKNIAPDPSDTASAWAKPFSAIGPRISPRTTALVENPVLFENQDR